MQAACSGLCTPVTHVADWFSVNYLRGALGAAPFLPQVSFPSSCWKQPHVSIILFFLTWKRDRNRDLLPTSLPPRCLQHPVKDQPQARSWDPSPGLPYGVERANCLGDCLLPPRVQSDRKWDWKQSVNQRDLDGDCGHPNQHLSHYTQCPGPSQGSFWGSSMLKEMVVVEVAVFHTDSRESSIQRAYCFPGVVGGTVFAHQCLHLCFMLKALHCSKFRI